MVGEADGDWMDPRRHRKAVTIPKGPSEAGRVPVGSGTSWLVDERRTGWADWMKGHRQESWR
jgi:hypothetical protein